MLRGHKHMETGNHQRDWPPQKAEYPTYASQQNEPHQTLVLNVIFGGSKGYDSAQSAEEVRWQQFIAPVILELLAGNGDLRYLRQAANERQSQAELSLLVKVMSTTKSPPCKKEHTV
jgi:hypothetical protein